MYQFDKCPKCEREICFECMRTILGIDHKESIFTKINWDKNSIMYSKVYNPSKDLDKLLIFEKVFCKVCFEEYENEFKKYRKYTDKILGSLEPVKSG